MIRIAAVGDLHSHDGAAGRYRRWYRNLDKAADILILTGDFTSVGTEAEAAIVAKELAEVAIPMVGVLGNHDYHSNRTGEIVRILEDNGVRILEGSAMTVEIHGETVGIVGAKGFGGGFGRGLLSPFGEPLIKAWVEETESQAARLGAYLKTFETDYRLVVLHYAPIPGTLRGEPSEIHAFLGCARLAEPIDRWGADLVLHGHAHAGSEKGQTETGVPVRNVALPVIQRPYALYELRRSEEQCEY